MRPRLEQLHDSDGAEGDSAVLRSGIWVPEAPGGGSAHIIEDSTGTDMTARTHLQFTGATVTDDAGNNRTLVAISGGGSTIGDRRWTEAASHAQNDEFRDASIDAAFVTVEAGGGGSRCPVTEAADSMSFAVMGGDAAAELHARVKPYALGVGETLIAHMSVFALATTSFPLGGIIVADGATYTSGTQIYWPILQSSGQLPDAMDSIWTGYNSRSAFTDRNYYTNTPWAYHMGIKRDTSNVWRYLMSMDGEKWVQVAQRTQSLTPSHIGMAAGSYTQASLGTGYPAAVFSFDYLRVSTTI